MTATTRALYVGATGCTCYIEGQRGVTTGFTDGPGLVGPEINGAFVKLDEGDRSMLFVKLGALVAACSCGRPDLGLPGHSEHCNVTSGRATSREVLGSRVIDRDEFDRINSIDAMRTEMGWRA